MQEFILLLVLYIFFLYVIVRMEKIIRILRTKKMDNGDVENLTAEDHPIIKAARERMEKGEGEK